MAIYNIVVGAVLLLFGRRLFWLFIGLAGFLFGLEAARMAFADQPHWLQLTIAIAMGGLGALLALVAQRLAFAVGGFFAGVYLALKLGQFFALPQHGLLLLMICACLGVIGAVVALLIMDKAIILLACLVGAGAVVDGLPLGHRSTIVVFLLLTLAGYLFQEKTLRNSEEERQGRGEV